MDFGELLKSSWDRFIKGIVNLILFTLVGVVLCITIILIPTVAGGLTRGFLKYVREGAEPEFSELWNFEDYLQILLLFVVGGIIVWVGYLLLIVPGVVLSVWWMYALFFLVDRKLGFWEAMGASKDAVSNSGFFQHFVVLIIVSVLNGLGGALSGLGSLVSMPYTLILMTLVYLEISGEKAAQ